MDINRLYEQKGGRLWIRCGGAKVAEAWLYDAGLRKIPLIVFIFPISDKGVLSNLRSSSLRLDSKVEKLTTKWADIDTAITKYLKLEALIFKRYQIN